MEHGRSVSVTVTAMSIVCAKRGRIADDDDDDDNNDNDIETLASMSLVRHEPEKPGKGTTRNRW